MALFKLTSEDETVETGGFESKVSSLQVLLIKEAWSMPQGTMQAINQGQTEV